MWRDKKKGRTRMIPTTVYSERCALAKVYVVEANVT